MSEGGQVLVMFDLDDTLLGAHLGRFPNICPARPDAPLSPTDADTDRYVFEVLAPKLRQRLEDVKKEWQWTDVRRSNFFL